MKSGRPPLPPERRRSARISVRVPESAKAAFVEEVERRDTTESIALREALADWMKKGRKK